jgi:hypothetical protein
MPANSPLRSANCRVTDMAEVAIEFADYGAEFDA